MTTKGPPTRVLIVGPAKAGKTRIANALAAPDAAASATSLDAYAPTVGVRIVEAEHNLAKGLSARADRLQLELWDASGDRKYESCWSAMLKTAQPAGVLVVYDPNERTGGSDAELWYKSFVAPLKLSASQVMIVAHQRDPLGKRSFVSPRGLESYSFCVSGLDTDEGVTALRSSFGEFVRKVSVAQSERSNAELEASMQAMK